MIMLMNDRSSKAISLAVLLVAGSSTPVAGGEEDPTAIEIRSMELWSTASKGFLELVLDEASDAIAMGHEPDGSIVVHLPNYVPGPEISDLNAETGLVREVKAEHLSFDGESWTRITVRTRQPASYSVDPQGNPLQIRFLRASVLESARESAPAADRPAAVSVSTPDAMRKLMVQPSADPCLILRVSPTIDSSILDCLDPGTRVIVLEDNAEWQRVRLSGGQEGWLAGRFLGSGIAILAVHESVDPCLILRQSPATSGLVVDCLDPGTRVTVLDEDGAKWQRVRLTSGQEGWLAGRFLDANTASHAVLDSVDPCLIMRQSPASDGLVLDCLDPGTRLRVLEESSGWKRVQLPSGRQGWVAERFVAEARQPGPG